MKDRLETIAADLVCVEPHLQEQLWRLADPDIDADTRQRLQDHVVICDACRLSLAIERRVEDEVRHGGLPRRRMARSYLREMSAGALVMAASLVLIFLVPPTRRGPRILPRGGSDEVHFLRPVEGEVIASARPVLEWSAIDGATGYEVDVAAMDGDYRWSGRTAETRVELPAAGALPGVGRYRAVVAPVPRDLALPGDLSVSFERAKLGRVLGYQLASSAWWTRVLGLLGLGFVVYGVSKRRLTAATATA